MRRPITLTAIAVIFAAGIAVGLIRAADDTAAPTDGAVAPEAAKALRLMCDRLEGAKSFTFRARVTWDTSGEHMLQFGAAQSIALRRPNRLRVEYHGDLSERLAWFDGRRFVYLDPVANLYAQLDAGPTLDAAMDTLFDKAGFNFPLSDFFYADAHRSLSDGTIAGEYIGLDAVEGVKCHHLAFSRETVDWQIWIDAGSAGLPRKFLMRYKLLDGAPQFSAIFDGWELDVEIPDAHFVPVLADDAMQIDFIASIQQGGR